MHYMGVKTKLIPWIFEKLREYTGQKPSRDLHFLDGCCGTGAVSAAAADLGFFVTANDLLAPAYTVSHARLCFPHSRREELQQHLQTIQALPALDGFFTRNYSPDGGRMYLCRENALRLDAARAYIQKITDPLLKSALNYSLIEALTRVQNTVGVQAAFLKTWAKPSQNLFHMREELFLWGAEAQVFQGDVIDLLEGSRLRQARGPESILYLDPPYVAREYATYYHLYETLVSDTDPEIQGVTGMPKELPKSEFCAPEARVLEFFLRVFRATLAETIAISYSSDSTVPVSKLLGALSQTGWSNIQVRVHPYTRYHVDDSREHSEEPLLEYLILGARGSDIFHAW